VTVAVVLEDEAALKCDCGELGLTEEDIDDVVDAICPRPGCIACIFSGDPSHPILTTT
jgi:hypothetical protein